MSRSLVLGFGAFAAVVGVLAVGGEGRSAVAGAVTPELPVALAVSPGGDLFVADAGRDAILERLPSGRFRIVAETGESPGRLVLAPSGALYFTQAGRYLSPGSASGGMLNTVIRELTPAGTIRTVAGLHPSCAPGPVRSLPAESALFYGALLSVSPTGALAVDARLCVGNAHAPGLGPSLLLTSSGRFVEDTANPVPAVASIDCGSGVPGAGFRVFGCMSGGGAGPYGHGRELLVVRSDGSSTAYPDYRGGELAVGDGEVVATHDSRLVRVTSSRLVPLVTGRDVQGALGLPPSPRALTDIVAPAIGRSGAIYFVASTITRLGCRTDIVERTAAGVLRRIWDSSPSKSTVCF